MKKLLGLATILILSASANAGGGWECPVIMWAGSVRVPPIEPETEQPAAITSLPPNVGVTTLPATGTPLVVTIPRF